MNGKFHFFEEHFSPSSLFQMKEVPHNESLGPSFNDYALDVGIKYVEM